MSFTRLRFRSSGKTSVSGMSQSLDAGDTSEVNDDSFDDLSVKRTVSAPSREGSATPPAEPPLSSLVPHSPTILEEPSPPEVQSNLPTSHICVMVEQDVCDRVILTQNVMKSNNPNGTTTVTTTTTTTSSGAPSKLQGIVQPVRPTTSSGWL